MVMSKFAKEWGLSPPPLGSDAYVNDVIICLISGINKFT